PTLVRRDPQDLEPAVTLRGRAAAVVGSLAVAIAGCTAIAHLKALQPPSPQAPDSSSTALARMPAPAMPGAPRVQLGVDVTAYTYPGEDIARAAHADVAFVRSLHANSVMVSFPFFASGRGSVSAGKATPSPNALGTVIRVAEQAGLFVLLRPLLDERGLGRSRVSWVPPSLPRWFASYRRFLKPYAEVAQWLHVPEFAVGAELSRFETAPGWGRLDTMLRRRYHGRLAFTLNWDAAQQAVHVGGPHVLHTVDAYAPQSGNFTAGWERYDRTLPRGTVETEIGIAAVRGANRAPSRWHWNVKTLDQGMQVRWFTAACQAAQATHLGGIYFWSIQLSTPVATGPVPAHQGAWAAGAGRNAIAQCFAAMDRGRRA
ncbi:MAG TPA: hypothetical protein VGS19_12030, partial [Streptosporangiaceae bacterium]|nr:hypothetical protein [Streptosporangiaceae bacterium]